MKKIMAIMMAVAMLLSVTAIGGMAAATACGVQFGVPASIYEDDVFEVAIQITGTETFGGGDFYFTYNSDIVEICKADGSAAATLAEAIGSKLDADTAKYMSLGSSYEAGSIFYNVAFAFSNANESEPATDPFTIFTVYFKAKAAGDAAFAFTTADTVVMSDMYTTAEETAAEQTITVQEVPNAPSITGATVAGTLKDEETVTASYTFNNGNKSGTTDDGDASEIIWYAGTEKVGEGATLTLTPAMVGSTIKYEVTPKVDRAEILNPTGEKVTSAESAVVMPKEGYVPTAEVVLPEELIATLEYTADVTMDGTYEAATDATTYAWYVADAADADVSALEAVDTDATASFSADDRDKYAIVVVTPIVTVNGTNFEGTAVTKAALIKGEPPVVDASAVKTDKELNVNKAIKVVEDKDFTAESKAPEGTSDELTIEYAWYLATVDEVAEFDPEGKDAVSTTNSYKPVKEDLGKFVILYITATDALGISTTVEVKYDLAIAKATGGAPAAGNGASLTVGGNNTEDPKGEDPKGEDPKVDEEDDPKGTANDKGAAAFTDVDKEKYAWAYDSIDALAKSGVIKGMTESTFGPDLPTTNAQVIALAVRIAGLKAEEGATTELVAGDHWVQTEMAAAEANEILGVFGEGAIAIDENTSREVAFTLLYNALKAAGVELPETAEAIEYSDAASIDAACVEAITALTKAGIVEGHGDGTVEPKAPITRAQLAKILGMANALIAK